MKHIVNEMARAGVVLVCSIVRLVSLVFSSIAWVFTKVSDLMNTGIDKLTTMVQKKLGKYEV